MKIQLNSQIQQPRFRAVNQKYYNWALKESRGVKRYGELLRELRYDVDWGDISSQDGIDTVNAIKKLMGRTDEFTEHVLEWMKKNLELRGR